MRGKVVLRARVSVGSGVVEGQPVEVGVRCPGCGRRLANYAARPYEFFCRNCKAVLQSAPLIDSPESGGVE